MKAELRGLRVAFLAGTLGQGGAERQLYYMVRALRAHGAEPLVLCLTSGEYWEGPIRGLGVPVTCVGQAGSRLRRLQRIAAEIAAASPHVVQSQHFFTNLYAALAGRNVGIPAIGAIRNDGISEVGSMWRPLGVMSLRVPRLVAANSRQGLENAVSLGARRESLVYLPNVVDTQQFDVHPRSSGGVVRLLSVGRLVRQKRVDRFLRLLAEVRRRTSVEVRGIVVGTGPDASALRSLAASLKLTEPALTFRDVTANVSHLYHQADALVLTSDWEGTPNVILEAMASGLPTISTRVGGVPAILPEGECGLLVEPGDEHALATAALQVVEDSQLRQRFGRAARRFVVENHSLEFLASALAALYERALTNGASR